jgi:hypothetical protein
MTNRPKDPEIQELWTAKAASRPGADRNGIPTIPDPAAKAEAVKAAMKRKKGNHHGTR